MSEFSADLYLVAMENEKIAALKLAEQIRSAEPHLRLVVNCGGGSFKSQFKKADRSGAAIALVLGEDEAAQGKITLKYLREDRAQESLLYSEALNRLRSL